MHTNGFRADGRKYTCVQYRVRRVWEKILGKVECPRFTADIPYIAFESPQSREESDLYVQTQIELMRGPSVLKS